MSDSEDAFRKALVENAEASARVHLQTSKTILRLTELVATLSVRVKHLETEVNELKKGAIIQ